MSESNLETNLELNFRAARPVEVEEVCEMLFRAEPETINFIYADKYHKATDFLKYEFLSGRGYFGYANVTVAELNGKVVGVGCLYAGATAKTLPVDNTLFRETLLNLVRFFGLNVWRYLLRARHLKSIMRSPRAEESYLSSFYVLESMRGQGIGRSMMRFWIQKSVEQGCKSMWLDISATNLKAEKFYKHLGFSLHAQKVFTGKREGFLVSDAKELCLILAHADNRDT